MTNEITGQLGGEIGGYVSAVAGMLKHIEQWPVSLLLLAVLIVIGSVMRAASFCPNRFVAPSMLILGSLGNALLGNRGAIEAVQYPTAVLAFQGIIIGFLSCFGAWALQSFVSKRFPKFIPYLAGRGDTMMISKSEIKEPEKRE